MKRRNFILTLLGLTVGPVLPARARQSEPDRRKVLLQTCALAGFQFHEGNRPFSRLRAGDAPELSGI